MAQTSEVRFGHDAANWGDSVTRSIRAGFSVHTATRERDKSPSFPPFQFIDHTRSQHAVKLIQPSARTP
jgi:hypothetical protein